MTRGWTERWGGIRSDPPADVNSACRIVKTRPETTYDSFVRDFGERLVPGYKAPSTVDFLMNDPFDKLPAVDAASKQPRDLGSARRQSLGVPRTGRAGCFVIPNPWGRRLGERRRNSH